MTTLLLALVMFGSAIGALTFVLRRVDGLLAATEQLALRGLQLRAIWRAYRETPRDRRSGGLERRRGVERRIVQVPIAFPDRRSGSDRRSGRDRRTFAAA
jgi:hypothetical protein